MSENLGNVKLQLYIKNKDKLDPILLNLLKSNYGISSVNDFKTIPPPVFIYYFDMALSNITNNNLLSDTDIPNASDFNSSGFNSSGFNSSGFNSSGFNSSGFNSSNNNLINPDIKNMINLISDNYNFYDNKNDLYKNVYNTIWNNTLKNLSKDDLKKELYIEPKLYSESKKLNIKNIENYINTIQTGGNIDQYKYLGINLTNKKISSNSNTHYIVTSLFDAYLNTNNIPKNKNIMHYSLCLLESIKLYLDFLPNYNIRIYGDKSIDTNINNNPELKNLFNLINTNDRIEYIEVEQKFNNSNILKNNKHIGLFGALIRYYALLDPKIEKCLIVDADNFPCESFLDIIKKWDDKQNNDILIFKPLFYSRKNINGDCIEQLLAGMSGYSKEKGKIINPDIFALMFEYMDLQYNKFKTGYNDDCDNNVYIQYTTPFRFGFEEQALTNILLPYFIHNKIDIEIIPMYFDFGNGFEFYYNELIDLLSDDFKKIIENRLKINKKNTPLLTYIKPEYSYNSHLGIIFINFLHKCIKDNISQKNDIEIYPPNNFDKIKKILSIKGFYHMYPSFNLTLPIDKIYDYILELYLSGNIKDNLEIIDKLPVDASTSFYKLNTNYININKKDEDFINKKPILNILKESSLYKNIVPPFLTGGLSDNNDIYKEKYLKYKQKYLKLKNSN